ncbi:hypothetical protein CLV62_14611 [Dysgonomonas alginatilytica]|uniref:Uncharacterized protein n=1 Tax=Dysgonomonas alginatilytica TaxID=1605892 RepID=A0A2V3PIJ0_9BACT|nr:hypothetical protein CLV62_14611 [Dysgonomonas alginatilytica]
MALLASPYKRRNDNFCFPFSTPFYPEGYASRYIPLAKIHG